MCPRDFFVGAVPKEAVAVAQERPEVVSEPQDLPGRDLLNLRILDQIVKI